MNIAPYLDRAFAGARNAWDTTLETFAPRLAFQNRIYREQIRELARIAANPQGAWKQAGLADSAASESLTAQRERVQIMWEAREVVKNFGFAKSILAKHAKYVTGQTIYQAQTDDNGVNAAYEDYIADWFERCDLTGRFPFRKLIEMAYLGRKIDGDCGIATPWYEDDIRLQVIQGDRIGSPHEYRSEEGYYGGVITDIVGRVAGFRIFRRTRDASYVEPMVFPAQNFHQLMNPIFADQYRGVSDFDTAIPSARMLTNIMNAEARAVQTLACQTAIVATKGNIEGAKRRWNQNEVEAALAEANKPVSQYQEIKPGTVNYVANGDSVTAFTYSRPSPAFMGLVQALFRDVCHAFDIDYGFFYDPTSYGGAVARLGSKQSQRTFKAEQRDLREQAIDPLIRKKLALGIARGEIPAHPRWRVMDIQFPEHASMDEGRDSKTDIEELKFGVTLLDEIVGRNGGNLDNHLDRAGRIARKVLDVAEKYQVPVTMIQQRTPNANEAEPGAEAPAAATTKPNPAEKTELEALREELTELRNYVRDQKGRFAASGSGGGRRSGNFVIGEARGRSVRVYFNPDGKPGTRRKGRRSYSRRQFRKAVRMALIGAGLAAAAGAAGYAAGRQTPPGSAPANVVPFPKGGTRAVAMQRKRKNPKK